ncbi:M48 family metallopeptidase [bacterium]|nr:M48 family metallopeptidase [bacterium]MCI0604953.1 M48 family metallopeptidase [bacterium]
MACYGKILVLLLSFTLLSLSAIAQEQARPFDIEKARAASQISDPEQATRAYLDSVPTQRRQKTKSYAHGNYFLDIVDFVYSSLILIGLLAFGVSAKIRVVARRITRFRPLQTALYWIQFLLLTTLFAFPMTLYRSYFREKAYGLLTQAFGDWMVDQFKELAVAIVLGTIFLMILYGVLRKAPRLWWLWGSVVMIIFVIIGIAIAPVYIQPLFNKFTPLKNAEIRESILSMARQQGIPAEEVYEMDASKRTDRISAYVAGLLGTMRIVMFDNTLKRCTPEEIQMIMGHEMGHYVLNHVWKHVAFFSVLILAGFLVARWGFHKAIRKWPNWQVEGVGDNAGFPLLILLLTGFLFLAGPISNTWIRIHEDFADDFGLDASREPDAAATTFLKLGEYRDLEPHPLIEALLYDHPSGRYRIRNAMEWKFNRQDAKGAKK